VWCEEHRNDGDEEDLGKRLRGEYVDPDRKVTAVTYRSAFKALWKCRECGYEWRARIYNRTGKNPRGCPSCSNRLPLSPTNNFAARCKENGARGARLLKEYDDPVTKPTEVAFASNKKVRWKCSKCKHTWEAVVQPHEERQTQRLPSVCGLRAPRPPEPDQQLRRVLRRQQRARRAATG
jgi:rubrerythrin